MLNKIIAINPSQYFSKGTDVSHLSTYPKHAFNQATKDTLRALYPNSAERNGKKEDLFQALKRSDETAINDILNLTSKASPKRAIQLNETYDALPTTQAQNPSHKFQSRPLPAPPQPTENSTAASAIEDDYIDLGSPDSKSDVYMTIEDIYAEIQQQPLEKKAWSPENKKAMLDLIETGDLSLSGNIRQLFSLGQALYSEIHRTSRPGAATSNSQFDLYDVEDACLVRCESDTLSGASKNILTKFKDEMISATSYSLKMGIGYERSPSKLGDIFDALNK